MRRGAQAYAPIIGSLGGFAVAAVVLVFTAHHQQHPGDATLLGLGTGLLVLALISSLLSAFVLAGIGAERALTPNLPAAALHAGTATAVGVVAMVAAFEVLSGVYLPSAKLLFALITIGAEVAAAVFVALVLGDAWLATLEYPVRPASQWLMTQAASSRAAGRACVAVASALSLSATLYLLGLRIPLGVGGTRAFVGVGIALSVASALVGVLRTWHPPDDGYRAIGRGETIVALGALTAYLSLLTLCLP